MSKSFQFRGQGVMRRSAGVVLGLCVAAAAVTGVSSWAQGPMHGPGMGMYGGPAMSPEAVSRRVEHLLRGVDATPEQRQKVTQIAQAAAKDLAALHAQRRSLHDEGRRLWTAPTVDAAAVEALRVKQQALHEQVSRRLSQALVEAGNVLTPAQRAVIAERIQARAEHMRHRAQGRGPGPMHGRGGASAPQ